MYAPPKWQIPEESHGSPVNCTNRMQINRLGA